MPQVAVPVEFFKKERNIYSNWRLAFWRELFQNAIDAAASRIDIIIGQDRLNGQDVTFVQMTDNGCGMDRQTLDDVYFRLGASTKGSDADSIGGFGRARLLTCFSMASYMIKTGTTHTIVASGIGGSYDVVEHTDKPAPGGCIFSVYVDDATVVQMLASLNVYLSESRLSVAVTVNGERRRTLNRFGRESRALFINVAHPDGQPVKQEFAKVYVTKSGEIEKNKVVVRVNGCSMYSIGTPANAYVVVEIVPNLSRKVLTANRDGMHYEYERILRRYLDELAVDTKSATRPAVRRLTKMVKGGRGFRRMNRESFQPKKPVPAAIVAQAVQAVLGTPAAVAHAGFVGSLGSGGVPISASPVASQEPMDGGSLFRQGTHSEIDDRQSDMPNVYIDDDTENSVVRRVIDEYDPVNWHPIWRGGNKINRGGTKRKVLMFWEIACEEAVRALLSIDKDTDEIVWGVGWTFSDTNKASHVETGGAHMLCLNPVDQGGRLNFAITDRVDRKRMMALAKHEAAHIGQSWHDESFANRLTEIDAAYDERAVLARMKAALDKA